ncbi:MAG: hypothetical protein IPO85_12305 [Saprospiraceae bacterium]|uniref:Uncharacterized protein n=1 Tax=Candidatus Defluviibacterium haderslevense TaxID=2981993 RepID=A0A9D7SAV3_9BACT|nr:hypothetical protein [Candidatus Defluviibacterium haderslevense]
MTKVNNIYIEVDTLDNVINSIAVMDYYSILIKLVKESNATIVVTFQDKEIYKLKYDEESDSLKKAIICT